MLLTQILAMISNCLSYQYDMFPIQNISRQVQATYLFVHQLQVLSLTHSCLGIYVASVVWTCHTLENNFGMKHKFANKIKDS